MLSKMLLPHFQFRRTWQQIAYLAKWYRFPICCSAPVKEADSLCIWGEPTKMKRLRILWAEIIWWRLIARKMHEFNIAPYVKCRYYAPWKQLLELNAETKDDVQREKTARSSWGLCRRSHTHISILVQFNTIRKICRGAVNLQTASDYNFDDPAMNQRFTWYKSNVTAPPR